MKLIHTGDLHIGSAFKALPYDRAKLRAAELVDGLRRLSSFAVKNGVFGVLIAGDLFDTNVVSGYVKREVLSVIASAPAVRFFYLRGNHDDKITFDEPLPDNLLLFSSTRGFFTYELPENITVTGVDGGYLNLLDYDSLRLSPQAFNIVMMHGTLVPAGGRDPDPVYLSKLQNKNINYLALGHIHNPPKAERLDYRGKYRYAGCLEGRGFDETGEKGFWLLEINGGSLTGETFVPFAKRRMWEISVTPSGDYFSYETAILQAVEKISENDMVKICLKGEKRRGQGCDHTHLTTLLNARFFFAKIEDETRFSSTLSQEKDALSLRGEFLRVLASSALDDEIKCQAEELGLLALGGEEIPL